MNIHINKNSKTPIYRQIVNQMSQKIISGELADGYPLPSERKLSELLGVNRTTVNKAYMELKSDGFILSQTGKGTMVQGQISKEMLNRERFVPRLQWQQFLNHDIHKNDSSLIKRVMNSGNEKETITLAGGFVNTSLLNMACIEKTMSLCFKKYGEKLFSASSVYGLYELRKLIASRMEQKGIRAHANQVIITSGSQQGVEYFARSLIKAGDMVIVEEPSYLGAIEIFKAYGAQVVGIPIDHHGMRVDILEKYLLKYRPKFIYTIPTYQNPSGVTMSIERRNQLLELAYLYRIPIVEDDPYSDIVLEGAEISALKALDRFGYVTYIGTISKCLFMGLRIGWVISDERLIEEFGSLKQISDLHTNTLGQYLLIELIKNKVLEAHIARLLPIYRHNKKLMMDTIESYHVPEMEITPSTGGVYLWCRLPQNLNMNEFVQKCRENKVLIMPGEPFFAGGTVGENYIRLNYSSPSETEIVEGIRRLMHSIKASIRVSTKASKKGINYVNIEQNTPLV